MKKLYTGFMIIVALLALLSPNSFGQKKIMFVGDDLIDDYQADRDLFDSLVSWGYVLETLDYYTDEVYATLTASSFDGYDGVFFSETMASSNITSYETFDYPLPTVNLEGYSPRTNRWAWLSDDNDEFFQTADGAGTEDDQIIVIKDNSHYITSIYNVGDEVKWSDATGADLLQNEPVSFKEVNETYSKKLAVCKSHSTMDGFWTMVTIDSSAAFPNNMFLWGMNAVGINGEDPNSLQHYGRQEFFTIIHRACDWAFGLAQSTTSVPENIYQPDYKLVAFPVPASDRVTVRFNTPNAVNARMVLYNVIGQRIETLLDKNTVVGNNFIFLDAQKYHPGIYYIGLEIEGNTEFAKIVVN